MIKRIVKNKKLKIALTSVMVVFVVALGTLGLVKADDLIPTNIATKAWAQADLTAELVSENAAFNLPLENINDGDDSVHYKYGFYNGSNVNEKLYLTFDDTYSVNEICVKFNGVNRVPEEFTVSVWNGSQWVEIGAGEDAVKAGSEHTWTLDSAMKCTAFRFHVTENSVEALWVREIEIMGVKSSEKLSKPIILTNTMNVAHGADVEFDWPSDQAWAVGFPPEELVDSITMSRNNFATTANLPENSVQEILLTLKEASQVDEVVLYPAVDNAYAGGFPADFTIEVWDGEAWIEVADVTDQRIGAYGTPNADVSAKSYEFEPMDIRAVRITVTKQGAVNAAGTSFALRLGEIKVNGVKSAKTDIEAPNAGQTPDTGVNAALNGTAEVNVPAWAINENLAESNRLYASNLVDGTDKYTTTEYVTNANTTDSMTVMFKDGAYEINRVKLLPRVKNGTVYGFPENFTVSVWNGTEWVEVASETGVTKTDAEPMVIDITPTVCNAVKIEVTKMGASDNTGLPYAFQLAELEAWGVESDVTITGPNAGEDENPDDTPGGDEEVETGVNAALNGNVELNVPDWAIAETIAEGSRLYATNLVDGTDKFTTTAYVASADTTESAVIIFKDGAYEINKVKLLPRVKSGTVYGFPVNFKVSVWNGTKWVEVAAKTGVIKNTTETMSIDITPTVCNAVKIEVTKMSLSDNAKQYTFQLSELEAWGEKSTAILAKPTTGTSDTTVTEKGTNAALNGTVEMNIPKWATSFPGSKLVDGATKGDNNFATTEYMADANTKESITVVFKDGAYTIDKIKLYPRQKGTAYNGGFPVDFTVSVWNGTKWVQVAAKTGVAKNTTEAVSLSITPTVCNAVKIEVTKMGESENAGKYTLQLAEIEAYGEKSSQKLAAPTVSGSAGSTGSGAVTIDNDKNLALNRPVKGSSDLAQYNAPITRVNDGNINSYWASNDRLFVKGEAQWAEVNLLNNFSIHTVVLGARQEALGFPIDFKIEVFYDGEWIEAHAVKGFEANEKAGYTAYEFTFPAVIGNKVRVSSDNFRKVGTSNSMVLTEIAVYGNPVSGDYVLPNENMITVGAGITATTSMEDYDYYLMHLIDGNLTTGWSTVPSITNDPQTVEIDMKGEVQLSEIQLKPSWGGHGFPIDFTISVYENGQWVDVYSAVDYEKPEDEAIQRFQFETKKVTKFRITATKLDEEAGLYVWKMNEIMAYPSHTGDEFDPNRVEEVQSSEKLLSAEVIDSDADSEKTGNVDVQLWKIIVGGILVVVAVAGCVTMLILSGKKKK